MLTRQLPTSPHVMGMESGGFDAPAQSMSRKRKAPSQDNERLSKRLSLLNIEKDGARLYVPVEGPHAGNSNYTPYNQPAAPQSYTSPTHAQYGAPTPSVPASAPGDGMMLDDSKHKVYIYNLDDELSSSESEDDSGRLVFLSDIDKHLRSNRIPTHVRPNSEGEVAGMQLVLYREPTSLTVPEEQDSVRRAVSEARERLREQQRARQWWLHGESGQMQLQDGHVGSEQDAHLPEDYDPDAMDMS